MSYQERIYNQNGKCNRNFVGPVPTLSSDLCEFNRPAFVMSGASSIECPEVTCNINDVPYNDLFTGTTNCFTESALSGSCFNGVDWVTSVYENDVLSYSGTFYTTTNFNGPAIDITTFSGSVVTAFDTLEYDYTFNGTGFTITDDTGLLESIRLELTTELDYDTTCFVTGNTTGDTSCSCPSGYTATTALDSCQKLTYTAVTVNGTGPTTVSAGDKNQAHGVQGTYWWPSIDSVSLPLVRNSSDGYGTLREVTTSGPTFSTTTYVTSDFWGKYVEPPVYNGRLNAVGVKNSGLLTDWIGFSECIDIETSGTYYIGIGANNACRFRLNGELILNLTDLNDEKNFKVWHMLPVTLSSGKHIIEMEGRNDYPNNATSFGAEIYSETLENLTGATTTGDTGLIFSSFNRIGTAFDLGELSGNSCPSGYSLDSCGDKSLCVKIEDTDIECLFTGSCSTNEIICDLDFSGLTLDSTNVHLLTGQTTFDLTFDFTGNTSTFVDTNARFKYEIYKYVPEKNIFNQPAVYSSDYVDWSTFSGTSAFTTAVTASTIDPDGQYLVKGHFLYDACTEFASLLGYNYATSTNITGESYSIYEPSMDFYFIAFTEADEPIIGNGDIDGETSIGGLTVGSIILDGTTTQFSLPVNVGDYIIALNGSTLAPDEDYSIDILEVNGGPAALLQLSGYTVDGDILTYIFTNSQERNSLVVQTFDVDSPIVSGATDDEGSNTIYYNTDTNKYELFLDLAPITNNDIILTLNGVTLANNIDYYQSISNPKRIILDGVILINDLLNAYYNASTNIQGNQFGTQINVSWSIENAPQTTDGIFTVEISDTNDFTTILSSGTTDYVIGVHAYALSVNLIGEAGDNQFYRVRNTKNFITLCNETLTSEKNSEIVPITIQTNANNSY